jgi:hypothetical protein
MYAGDGRDRRRMIPGNENDKGIATVMLAVNI